MKPIGIALLLTAVAAQGDILSDTLPFLRPAGPDYSPEQLEPTSALEDQAYAPFSPADSDLGVQQILGSVPDKAPVNIMVGLNLHYTDNAPAAAPALQDGSFLIAARIGASWQPLIANGWFADIGITQEFYEFDHGDAIDFENMQPYIGVVKNLVDLDDTLFYARYEYQRLTTGSISDSDYSAQRIRTGLQKTLFVASRQRLAGGISTAFDIHANPDQLERREYAVDLSYTYALTHKLDLTAFGRSALWEFHDGGREDLIHLAGLELSYRLCRNATASTSIYYTQNDSNAAFGANDSKSWQTGLDLGINYSF